jgi:hypothetical protein
MALSSVLPLLVLASQQSCRGESDRTYFDDTVDGSGGEDGNATDGNGGGDDASGQNDGNATTDGTSDANEDAGPGDDTGVGIDADTGTGPDANDVDTGADTGAPDSGADVDAGCPTNLPTSCGTCGVVCNTTTSSAPTCNGTTCLYACLPNKQNCNATAPDPNGCECDGTACCGSSCQTAHSNGVGQTFYDCNPLDTYNQTTATAACAAFTGSAASCTAYACTGNAGSVVCSPGGACTCWKYDPGNSGVTGKVSTSCGCPVSSGATSWH